MISLLLGFLTSGIPHVLDFFKAKQEDKAEAERLKEQNRHDEALAANQERQAVISAQAAMQAAAATSFQIAQAQLSPLPIPSQTGIKWIDALDDLITVLVNAVNQLVRPWLAIMVSLVFFGLTGAQVYGILAHPEWGPQLQQIMALATVTTLLDAFGAVIGLYFGDRGFRYALGKMK